MEFKGKLINQTSEIAKNLVSSRISAPLAQKFFLWILPLLEIVASYHSMQFQGKLMNQTGENDQKN